MSVIKILNRVEPQWSCLQSRSSGTPTFRFNPKKIDNFEENKEIIIIKV